MPAKLFTDELFRPVKSFQTSSWNNLHPNQVIGKPAVIKEIDCLTATVKDILQVEAKFSSPIHVEDARLSAFAGWFDVHFRVSSPSYIMDL